MMIQTFVKLILVSMITAPVVAQAEDEVKWYDRVKMGADFRYRHEMSESEGDKAARHRQRIRARVSLKGEVDEDVSLHMRLATGVPSATSGNQTLDDGFQNKGIGVDKAYAKWKVSDESTFKLGKFGTPFYKPQKSQLLWDSDLTPEGFAYKYKRKGDDQMYMLNLAGLWVNENNNTDDTADQGLLGAQLGAEFSIGDPKILIAIGNYVFNNLKDSEVADIGSAKGNSTSTNAQGNTSYLYDYNILEALIEVKADIAEMPSAFYVDYVQNSDPSDNNTGYIAGFRIGKVKEKGDFQFIYNFRKVEADAVVAAFQDSDFGDGQTDVEGHTIAIVYGVFKNSKLALALFDAERGISGTPSTTYDRAHLDFSFKF